MPPIEVYRRAVPILIDVLGFGTMSALATLMTTQTPTSLSAIGAQFAYEAAQFIRLLHLKYLQGIM